MLKAWSSAVLAGVRIGSVANGNNQDVFDQPTVRLQSNKSFKNSPPRIQLGINLTFSARMKTDIAFFLGLQSWISVTECIETSAWKEDGAESERWKASRVCQRECSYVPFSIPLDLDRKWIIF